jgi:heme/copper-type cytochrome/quinol oxidase subunit 2
MGALSTARFLQPLLIETICTIAPEIILVFIAIPFLRLLYLIDEIEQPGNNTTNSRTPMILKL